MARDSAKKNNLNAKDCQVQLTFFEQKMYPYEDLAVYLNLLRHGRPRYNCSACWDFIHPTFYSAKHSDSSGLHIADLVASSLTRAIERKRHGMTDDRFQRNLAPILYRNHGKQFGLKLFPSREMEKLRTEDRFDFLKLL